MAEDPRKIRSLQDILAIRNEAQKKTALREDGYRMCFTVHMGTCGIASGARDVVNAMAEELEKSGRTDIRLTTSGCIGACEHEPVMTVETRAASPSSTATWTRRRSREVFAQTLAGKSASAYVVYVGTEPSDAETKQGRARHEDDTNASADVLRHRLRLLGSGEGPRRPGQGARGARPHGRGGHRGHGRGTRARAKLPWSAPAATASAPAGPIMVVYPGGFFYQKLTPEDMPELVEEHVLKGRPVERLMFRHPVTQAVIPHYADIPFFARQNLRVLHNKGRISATSIEEYIGRGGYIATAKALLEMTPQGHR